VEVSAHLFHVVADASIIKTYTNGSSILLHLPADKIWVLPEGQGHGQRESWG
jgi:hypothetical protein